MAKSVLHVAIILAATFCPAAFAQSPGQSDVAVTGVRNADDVVRCGLYNSAASFPKTEQRFKGVIAHIANGQATCVFNDIPPGIYAVGLFHAEHDEPEIKYSFWGVPEEGYGFSQNPSTTFGTPSFGNAAFDYRGGHVAVPVTLTYR